MAEEIATYGDLLKEKLIFQHYDAVDVEGFHQDARDEISMDFTAFMLHMSALIIMQIDTMSQIGVGKIINRKTGEEYDERVKARNGTEYVSVLSGVKFFNFCLLEANVKTFFDWFLKQPVPENSSECCDSESFVDYFGMENLSDMWNKFAKIQYGKWKQD